MDNPRKGFCELGDLLHIDRTSDIRSTTADEGADARFFFWSHFSLWWILLFSNQRPSCFSNSGQGLGCSATGLDDTIRDIFRFCKGPTGKHPRTIRFGRSEIFCVTELMGIEVNA